MLAEGQAGVPIQGQQQVFWRMNGLHGSGGTASGVVRLGRGPGAGGWRLDQPSIPGQYQNVSGHCGQVA